MNPVMVIAGTRPEVIKLSPVIKWLQKLRVDTIFTWSGQHYDYELSSVFFKQLDLPEPDANLDVRSGSHSRQTAKAMIRLEKTIAQYKPSLVVAEGDTEGDTNTACMHACNSKQLRNIDNNFEIIGTYNQSGYPQLTSGHNDPIATNTRILVRAPLKK